MTSFQLASINLIESLREENRLSASALYQAQNNIKLLEKQIQEKDQIIGVLEQRIRLGANSFLENSIRQKDLTIKHLELQVQKLLKQNEELEDQINSLKSEICPRCETNILLGIADEKAVPKGVKSTRPCLSRKVVQHDYADRQKMLERIIEHKDKRILHLSKEVKRLTEIEKELNYKTYRLSKLLPLSNLPSEVITECLLKEIQLLEAQIQTDENNGSKRLISDGIADLLEHSSKSDQIKNRPSASGSKYISTSTKVPKSRKIIDEFPEKSDGTMSNLHSLYNDINELRQMFTAENEKLQQCLNRDSLKYDLLKVEWKDIISRLNDIADAIQNIIHINSSFQNNDNIDYVTSKDPVILCLQEKLKKALELSTEYKNEKESATKQVSALKERLSQLERSTLITVDCSVQTEEEKNPAKTLSASDLSDVNKLKESLNIKQTQLDAAYNHIQTCQNFIQLQNNLQKSNSNLVMASSDTAIPGNSSQMPKPTVTNLDKNLYNSINQNVQIPADSYESKTKSSIHNKKIKSLETKLEVSEKHIKNLEDVIETLQNKIVHLEEENQRLDGDLHVAQSEKIVSEASTHVNSSLNSKLKEVKSQLNVQQTENNELNRKVETLTEENIKLLETLNSHKSENETLKASVHDKALIQMKLDAASKHLDTFEVNIMELQNEIEKLKEENTQLRSEVQISKQNEAYSEEVVAMKNELIIKEDEIQNLKESLRALENKAIEMNHYRRTLRKELENLCNTLMEDSESNVSSAQCKAIYKAAVLRSAQALLQFDVDEPNLTDSQQSGALEEMKHQVSVYLTEVARINELLSIKNQQREELLKEYLDVNDELDVGVSSSHQLHVRGSPGGAPEVESIPAASSVSSGMSSDSSSDHQFKKNIHAEKKLNGRHTVTHVEELRNLQEELSNSKSIATYFMTSCTKLEEQLMEERKMRSKSDQDVGKHLEFIKELKSQLKEKNSSVKKLESMISMMRAKECNDEIGIEQQKSEIQWLKDENKKMFDKITEIQMALCKCKEENSRIENDLNHVKRQLVNEKYEHAKVDNELKHLRQQLTYNQSNNSNT